MNAYGQTDLIKNQISEKSLTQMPASSQSLLELSCDYPSGNTKHSEMVFEHTEGFELFCISEIARQVPLKGWPIIKLLKSAIKYRLN